MKSGYNEHKIQQNPDHGTGCILYGKSNQQKMTGQNRLQNNVRSVKARLPLMR